MTNPKTLEIFEKFFINIWKFGAILINKKRSFLSQHHEKGDLIMENVLVLQQVSKKFGQQYALTDVSLTIKKEIFMVWLARTVRKDHSDQGHHPALGSKLMVMSPSLTLRTIKNGRRASNGSVPVIRTPVAHNHLTAYEKSRLPLQAPPWLPHADKVIRETLEYVDLTDTGKKNSATSHSGMKQRLGLAIASLTWPDTGRAISSLNPVGIKEFRQLVQRLQRGVGHDLYHLQPYPVWTLLSGDPVYRHIGEEIDSWDFKKRNLKNRVKT